MIELKTAQRPRVWPTPLPSDSDDIEAALTMLRRRLAETRPHNIGFPTAVDFDYTPLAALMTDHFLNNVGDPYVDGTGPDHTKAMERDVVAFVADLFRAPRGSRWGYLTSGGTESNLYALHQARRRLPGAVVYHSETAHYSIKKAVDILGVPSVVVRALDTGEVDYNDLASQLARHAGRPAVVVANIGTTMTEAIDDIRRISTILDELGISRRFIHADAALAGIPLALLDPADRPGCDFADGADSVAISGHKFIGSPFPCGVVIIRTRRPRPPQIPYIQSPDTTIAGSRSGHAPIVMWYALARLGIDGLRKRAEHARTLAAYTCHALTAMGWSAYRSQPHAFTVMLRTPPPSVRDRWTLASSDGWSHIVCMPGITTDQINAFLTDLETAQAATPPPAA